MANFLIKNGVDENGAPIQIKTLAGPWADWAGTGIDNAPAGLGVDAIGFDSAGDMYDFTEYNDTWVANGQTKAGFMGL